MSTQWHPLFAYLLRLQLDAYFSVDTEVPVSELPRRADILLLRRTAGPAPPFDGLWSHLTDWNVFEFKGPTDAAEEADLDLLLHVGTGIAYRLNEERRARGEAALPNSRVALWFLAPFLSPHFLERARQRLYLDFLPEGVWRGRVFGHPFFLVNCRELPIEPDGVPLRLVQREPQPRALGELLAGRPDLWTAFGSWLATLQPDLWKEIQHMATVPDGPVFHLDTLIECVGLRALVEAAGVERLVREVGVERLVRELGVERAVEGIGVERVIEAVGRDKLLKQLLRGMTPEQKQELLRENSGDGTSPTQG